MIRKIAIAALSVSLTLPALAHEVDCEKHVGILQTDSQGEVVLGEDGAPLFSVAPGVILKLDSYPVTIGWHLKVNNLAGEPSIVQSIADPFLTDSGATFFGAATLPFEIPSGESFAFVAGQRIASYEQCLALGGAPEAAFASEENGVPAVPQRAREPAHRDDRDERRRVSRSPRLPTAALQRAGVDGGHRVLRPRGEASSTVDLGYGVAVGCDGETHVVGEASYLATPGRSSALLARLDAAGAVVEGAHLVAGRLSAEHRVVRRAGSPGPPHRGGGLHPRGVPPGGRAGRHRRVGADCSRVTHGPASFRAAKPDAEGNVYAALVVSRPSGEPPGGVEAHDAVVRKYTPAGALVWETFLSTARPDEVTALAVTPLGDVFVTGLPWETP